MPELSLWQKIKLLKIVYQLYQLWGKMDMKGFFGSKKVKALILGGVSIVLINVIGLPETEAAKITEALNILFGIYVAGQSIADGLSKGATSSANNK